MSALWLTVHHVPYASRVRPSAGHPGEAVRAAVASGLVGGLPLSLQDWRSPGNLLAVVVAHASLDLIPALHLFV